MAVRIGAPGPVLELSGVVAAQKVWRLGCGDGDGDGVRVRCVARVGDSGYENLRLQGGGVARGGCWEARLGGRKVRFVVGKRVLIGSGLRGGRRRVAGAPVASGAGCDGGGVDVEIGSGEDRVAEGCGGAASPSGRSDGAEGGVHLGRRVLIGSVFTAVALSNFDGSGLALAEGGGNAGKVKTKSKGGNSPASGKNGEDKNEGPQFGDKWKFSRVYDASVLGEPVAVGGDRSRVWQKLLQARVVYLGEAERVPDSDDRVLELGIVRKLRDACFEEKRPVSLALDAFPVALQKSLDTYMSKRLSDDELKSVVGFLPQGLWQEYLPLLQYCRTAGVRLMACGTPPEVLRTIQAEGIKGLSEEERKKYVPPVGGGFGAVSIPFIDQLALAESIPSATVPYGPSATVPYGPGPFQYSQARMVADHVMTQIVEKAMVDGGSCGLLIVITGASHVTNGSKGTGLPARVQKKLYKKTQAVVLLNPERQRIRKEGNVPDADFLWYSAARACNRNCFDRAEVARVMNAAGLRRDTLPQDIQAGLERGLVDPEVLKSFFELDQQPIIAELTRRFQGLRERWLADPRFLQRLAIEEAISISTTLVAQYQRRGDRFWKEMEYVITDTVRGAVVDFFTVWLPAPTLSFRSLDSQGSGGFFEGFATLLGTVPDNAFQRARLGESYALKARVLAVILGGVKLFGVGFISSIGTLSVSNGVWAIRKAINRDLSLKPSTTKRSPIFKSAFVYASFLGLSSNLRYQAIAGIIEHWIADYYLASQPLAGSVLSFATRVGNSYWATSQWINLARWTGLQSSEDEDLPSPVLEEQEGMVEDSTEAIKAAWEQPSSSLESTDEVDNKQESETNKVTMK